jgi:Domain of unknown function (DUF6916)
LTARSSSRRHFLRQTAAVGAAALLLTPGSVLGAWLDGTKRRGLHELSAGELRALRGQRFRVRTEDGAVLWLRLVDVSDRSRLTRAEGIRQLSVVFRSGARDHPRQFVGEVSHAEIHNPSLLLVPVLRPEGLRGRGIHFEAVFSRFV